MVGFEEETGVACKILPLKTIANPPSERLERATKTGKHLYIFLFLFQSKYDAFFSPYVTASLGCIGMKAILITSRQPQHSIHAILSPVGTNTHALTPTLTCTDPTSRIEQYSSNTGAQPEVTEGRSDKLRTESYAAPIPPAESYGVPAPYPTPLATHRALQGGMARAARHRDSPIPHGDREAG